MPAPESDSLAPRAARADMVYRLASSLGFALVGVAPAKPSEHADDLRDWLDAGKHGDMDYLARYANVAVDPDHVLPGAKAIICVADRYLAGDGHDIAALESGPFEQDPAGGQMAIRDAERADACGRIARYAQGDDYHRVIKKRLHDLCDGLRQLFPDHLFRAAVDTAPVMEREHAARAGLGWIGKHTLLLHPHFGSYFLLGEILTTLPIGTNADAGYPAPTVSPIDHCGTCTRCIDACPTQCITPYSVDASRCISYLTIEHRGLIESDLHPLMGGWLAGCDVCQDVCPFNRHADASIAPNPAYAPRMPSLPLLQVLAWGEADRRAAFTRSALKRIKLDMFKRNALIAAGNHLRDRDDEDALALRSRIEAIAEDAGEADLVRGTARQVLDRLAAAAPPRP